ncbi:MAG: PilZ domain-containing protein, partial [Deltaproteobacteria bacterium]|nr:PilZ domain-containing protein [Deltaproteobacteria bacterium]
APAPEPTGPDAQPPQQPDEEPATEEQPAVTSSMGSALRGKGLGKRKLAGRLRRPLAGASPFAKSPEPAPQPDVAAALSADVLTSEMESVFFEDDASIPPAQGDPVGEDDATLPPSAALMDGFFSHATPELHSTDSPPPVNLIGEELEATDSFVERFGNVEANFGFDFGGELESEPQSFGSEPGTLPPEFIAPASIPAAPVPTRPDQSPQRIGTQRRRKTDSRRPPLASQAVVHDSAPAERPPWEDEIASGSIASLIPRNARIASTVDVTFWARGRRNQAMADNFSREGLFLNYAGTPPVRGAIVRVEFPVHGADESVSVRFNAEVRWHRSDRPGVGLADGFGVQILTFESPKDRARYEELLDAILALGPGPSTDEGFSWGRPGS